MELPKRNLPNIHGSQSGQAIIEYILVLVVTVALIFGGMYQLNTAFKVWAKGYFGDYLSCLLETGELPDIGGTPGDSSVCKEAFTSFDLKNGGPGLASKAGKGGGGANDGRGGSREGGRGGGGGGNGTGSNGSRFAAGSNFGRGGGSGGKRGGSDSNLGTNTGNTSASGGVGGATRAGRSESKDRLDNRFAFDNESNDKSKKGRSFASSSKSASAPSDDGGGSGRKGMSQKNKTVDPNGPGGDGMTFGDFIRYLIIAAIIIALFLLIGGQMLQISKSGE